MKVTFLKDEYNNLWFFEAKDIIIRDSPSIKRSNNFSNMDFFKIMLFQIFKKIENIKQNDKEIEILANLMRKKYERIKAQVGIIKSSEEQKDDLKLDEVFKTLRPNSNMKLSDILDSLYNTNRIYKDTPYESDSNALNIYRL